MYPDLKDFRKELSFVGPWIISGRLHWTIGLFIGFFFVFLSDIDKSYNNVFPWFIEALLIVSILSQYVYFYSKLKLGSKNEKDKIQTIVDVNFIKKTISPILFYKLQLRYFLLLRAPYFIFIQIFYYQIQDANGFKPFNFTQNLFFCILHILFLLYDYFSFRDTINKLSTKPIPLTPNKDYVNEIFDYYKSSESSEVKDKQIIKKNTELKNKKINKKDSMLKKFLDK